MCVCVLGSVRIAAPSFTAAKSRLRDVNVTEGESVNFTCETYADPPAMVVWLRNTVPLNGAAKVIR